MPSQPRTAVTYTTEPAVVTVVELKNSNDLEWFKDAIETKILGFNGATEKLQLNEDKTILFFEQWYTVYGGSDSRNITVAKVGSFVAWNQAMVAEVGSSSVISAFPSHLFKPVVVAT